MPSCSCGRLRRCLFFEINIEKYSEASDHPVHDDSHKIMFFKIHQTHQTWGNSLFLWGFSMVFKGEIWGTHPTNWRIFPWTQQGFSRGAIIPESFSSSSCGAGFPPMVCRQHVWWVAKAAVYRHLAKWNHFYAAFAPFLCPKMSEHCK